MKTDCKSGKHKFIEILHKNHSWDGSAQIARWCSYCGSVRVDLDFDNKSQAGIIKIPQILYDEKL